MTAKTLRTSGVEQLEPRTVLAVFVPLDVMYGPHAGDPHFDEPHFDAHFGDFDRGPAPHEEYDHFDFGGPSDFGGRFAGPDGFGGRDFSPSPLALQPDYVIEIVILSPSALTPPIEAGEGETAAETAYLAYSPPASTAPASSPSFSVVVFSGPTGEREVVERGSGEREALGLLRAAERNASSSFLAANVPAAPNQDNAASRTAGSIIASADADQADRSALLDKAPATSSSTTNEAERKLLALVKAPTTDALAAGKDSLHDLAGELLRGKRKLGESEPASLFEQAAAQFFSRDLRELSNDLYDRLAKIESSTTAADDGLIELLAADVSSVLPVSKTETARLPASQQENLPITPAVVLELATADDAVPASAPAEALAADEVPAVPLN